MASDTTKDNDMPVSPASHLWDDGFDDVHGSEKIAFELISNQSLSSWSRPELFDSADDCFTRAAEENVNFIKLVYCFSDCCLTLCYVSALYIWSVTGASCMLNPAIAGAAHLMSRAITFNLSFHVLPRPT